MVIDAFNLILFLRCSMWNYGSKSMNSDTHYKICSYKTLPIYLIAQNVKCSYHQHWLLLSPFIFAVILLSSVRHSHFKDVNNEFYSRVHGYNLPVFISFFSFLQSVSSTCSIFHVFILNLIIVGAGVIMACFYPNIGGIIRYCL